MKKSPLPSNRWRQALALVVVPLLLLLAQTGGRAAPGDNDALPYSKGFLGTLNYVTSTVDLNEQANPIDQSGFSSANLSITGVPPDADIMAAYLYWETITLASTPEQAAGARFRGHELVLNDIAAVKKSSWVDSTASCWSSGQPLALTLFRADVLQMLPVRYDKDGKPTPKRIVNDADLAAHGEGPHTVYLPARSGNQVPETAGATLVILFSDPTQPLRKIVFYDGIHVQPSVATPMTQTLQGFYKSSAVKDAKLTHILAAGQPNGNERVLFNDTNGFNPADPFNVQSPLVAVSAPDPVPGGTASQRGWSSPTYDVSQLMNPGANSTGGYGETARTWVDHSPSTGSYDCLTWGAVIFSVAVDDDESGAGNPLDPNDDGPPGDGLPDGLEEAQNGLTDPDDTVLPNLYAMGARSNQRDLFVEINAMWAPEQTSYGSTTPYGPAPTFSYFASDTAGHVHLPTPADLAMVGQAFDAHGIKVHFDVGDVAAYKSRGVVNHPDWIDNYDSNVADPYLVSTGARGGELIQERACDADEPTCHFPDFPGTVGWKFGLQVYRDAPVGDNGEELLAPFAEWDPLNGRRRFDRARFGLFHYALWAHGRGTPKSQPCLIFGLPGPYDANNDTECTTPNPSFVESQYHVPTSASGVADLPGGNMLITLGFWDDFVGRPFVRASTLFHELGHNLDLWHGGLPAVWGDGLSPADPLDGTSTYVEPNCKPNYQSSMSYMFQVHGLFDNLDNIHLDYSNQLLGPLDDTAPPGDGAWSPVPNYRWAWYVPATSPLATSLGVSPATRYCNGAPFDLPTHPNPVMARVLTPLTTSSIDWDGGYVPGPGQVLDVNFDNAHPTTLNERNDWANIRLNQISAGRRASKFQVKLTEQAEQEYGDFIDFGSGDFIDFGSGDFIDFGSGDFIDFGSGDFIDFGSGSPFEAGDFIDFGSGVLFEADSGDFIDFGSGDFIDFGSGDFIDFGSGDFIDFGSGDFIDFGSGQQIDLDFDAARGIGRPTPYALSACIIAVTCQLTVPSSDKARYQHVELSWQPVPVGRATYLVFRKRGDVNSTSRYTQIGTTTTNVFVDPDSLANGTMYTYRLQARFTDTTPAQFSAFSNTLTITYPK